MANENIGTITCPACELDASVRNSKKGKAYIVCEDCGYQGFARGHDADKHIRTRMTPIAAAIAAMFPAPQPAPIEVTDMTTTKKKTAPKKPAAPTKKTEPEKKPDQKPANDEFGSWLGL